MTLVPPPPAVDEVGHVVLAARFAANCRALGVDLPPPAVDACFARDGSTTAKRDGRWLAGCSVPRRAAERMIRKENWPHRSLCLLAPTHGQQIEAVLARLPRTSAVIAVVTSLDDLADALACCDVAADAVAGRLHVAWDGSSLAAIFDRHPGLAVPRQIVRLPDADPANVAVAMPWTQATLTAVTAEQGRRASMPSSVTSGPATDARCVVVGRHFGLWDDAGDTLVRVSSEAWTAADAGSASCVRQASLPANEGLSGERLAHPALGEVAGVGSVGEPFVVVNTDHPLASADALVAERTAAASATVADRARPAWAVAPTPWVAWLTGDDVPPFNPAFAADALLLTTPAAIAAARAVGWPASRLSLAGWPGRKLTYTPGGPLALLCDLPSLDAPADVADLSSRQLVWDAIREELSRDPFALGDDVERYVRRAPARLGLPADDAFPVRRFVHGVVGPAFAVGVATWLASRGVAFTLHGRGWDAIDVVADVCRGPVADRETFETTVATSGGMIDAFLPFAHPCHSLGVPVLTVLGRTPQRVMKDVATINGGHPTAVVRPTPLTPETIRRLLDASA